jgi:cysteine-rich secretory family protein
LAAALDLAACGAATVIELPNQQVIDRKKEPATPSWVSYYNSLSEELELNSREQQLWNEVATRTELDCRIDRRLVAAAREHAGDLVESPGLQSDADIDRLRFSLQRSGNTDYGIQPLVDVSGDKSGQPFVDIIAKRGKGWSHCGLGISGTNVRPTVVWIGVWRVVELKPFPVRVTTGANVQIRGRLLIEKREAIQPFVGRPSGAVERLSPVIPRLDGQFSFNVPLHEAGRNELELMVDAGRGPETVVLVPIFVGVEPDSRPVVGPHLSADDDSRSPNDILFDYLAIARRKLRLSGLRRDLRLEKVALRHSVEMLERGFFGHISPYRGALEKRLQMAGLSPLRSAENIARSSSLLRVHRNLMSSPSHRINLLDPQMTHVGIGVAREGQYYVVTEVFAKW